MWTTTVVLFLGRVFAASTQECDSGSGVCVAFSIPTVGDDSASTDILATIQAPGFFGWVGFGFGQQMAGSLVFVVWEDNSDVVVSPRYASGQFEPAPYSGPMVQVLASNHTSDLFTAELSISNATTWQNSGKLDVNSANAGVIWSLSSVDVYEPSNPDTDFQQHQTMGVFGINMKAAQQTASPTASGTDATGTPATPAITGAVPEPAKIGLTHRDKVIIAHGTLMGIAFVIIFPLGAIIIRFLSRMLPMPTRFHYMTQIFGFICVLTAMGLGIYLSKGIQFIYFRNSFSTPIPLTPDQIFGITIICLLAVQLGFGYYHHRRFVKDSPTYRRWFTYVHLWLGRLLIVLGLANAGCGLKLAFVQSKYVIAWWATCGFLAIVYALVSLFAWYTRDRKFEGSGRWSPGGEIPGAGNYNFENPRLRKAE